jgi:hypothetical protein
MKSKKKTSAPKLSLKEKLAFRIINDRVRLKEAERKWRKAGHPYFPEKD